MAIKSFLKTTMLAILVGMVFGCDKYGGDVTPPYTCSVYVKFVLPSGTDVLDSIYGNTVDYPYYMPSDDFTAECYKDDEFFDNIINVTVEDYSANKATTIGDGKKMDGKTLVLRWGEWVKDEAFSLTYAVKMRSKKIYGDKDAHDIKLYLQAKGNDNVNVYKIAADGEDIPYTGIYHDTINTYYGGNFDGYVEIIVGH